MMAGHGGSDPAVGGPARHIPVLLPEVLEALGPLEGRTIVDGTFGAGGYSGAILEAGASVIAIDRDPDAIRDGQEMVARHGGRLRLVQGRFGDLDKIAGAQVDGVVLDIGVSSMQLDQAVRGFSFRNEGPLDMRMAQEGVTAAEVVNTYKVGDIARILNFLGEERQAGRLARMIERRRAQRPFVTTRDLAEAIESTIGRGMKDKIHPATRSFQALRIYVNNELGELADALFAAERALKPGGRLVVVSFHSLEDRMVKRFMADRAGKASGSRHLPEVSSVPATFEKSGGVVGASEEEAERNPRARSAKLRMAVRTGEPARAADPSILSLPDLPRLPSSSGT
jgi:16S rRNA (cytosine1402-N4)-methyltransferase